MTAAPNAASPPASPSSTPPEASGRPDWPPVVVPIVVLAIAAAVIVAAIAGTTFFFDEWIWIMQRRSFDEASLLQPFNNHLMAMPIATYAVFYRVFGLDSPLPYQLALLAGHLATCALLYVYLRRRIGWVLAVGGAAALAFFGYTWPVIIWPISLGWVYATTAGVAALLLVDRDSKRSDIGAMAALLVGIASSGIAVPFVIGLAVELALKRAWDRVYVAVVPLAVFGAWYLGYASGTSDSGSVGDVVEFAEKLLAQTFGTLLGIDDRGTAAHVVLAVGLVAIAVLWFALGRPHSPRLVGNAAALASFTALLSYSRATSGLTQWHSYAAAVFVLLTLGELVAGRSIPLVPTVVVLAVVAWSIVWNLGELQEGSDLQRMRAEEMRAQLAAVELAGGSIDPDMRVGRFLLETRAGPWLEVSEQYGSPAYSAQELRDAPRHARRAANALLVSGGAVELEPVSGTLECELPRRVTIGGDPIFRAGPAGAQVYAGVAEPFVLVGEIPPGESRALRAPDETAWRLDGGSICVRPPDL